MTASANSTCLLLALVGTMAACGGDDDTSGSASDAGGDVDAASSDQDPDAASGDEDPDAASNDEDPDAGDGSLVCDPGTFDLDGSMVDGCEFLLDTDAIYVSGDDPGATSSGTCGLGPVGTGAGNAPCTTITQGLARATAIGRSKVLVADALYAEAVILVNGKSLLGAHDPDTWERHVDSTLTLIQGTSSSGNHDRTVVASAITAATVFEGFVVRGSLNAKTGGNSYAIYVSGSNGNLALQRNVIHAGRGGPGGAGGGASDGADGEPGLGRASSPTTYDAFIASGTGFCNSSNNRQASNGGALTCDGGDVVSGGAGGGNECPVATDLTEASATDGANGQAGAGGGGGGAGLGNDAGDDMRLQSSGSVCVIPAGATLGADGTDGSDGTSGGAVAGCSATGSVTGGHFVIAPAASGVVGANGGGGGGGGAGAGGACVSCVETKDRLGAHGGGGGSGGCGGGGSAGGSAFGIFVVGVVAPVITDNVIVRGEGGNGGNGGNGGVGGLGADGGDGGTSALFCAEAAGDGGLGGDGGHGSGGGGGCGGSSFGIYTSGIGTPGYCTTDGNQATGGAAGGGGTGGLSLVNSGGDGAAGALTACRHD
jgi:hypothetical protein